MKLIFVPNNTETINFKDFIKKSKMGLGNFVVTGQHEIVLSNNSKLPDIKPYTKKGWSRIGLTTNKKYRPLIPEDSSNLSSTILDLENANLRSLALIRKNRPVKTLSLYINPLAFVDINFLLIGAGVILIAVLEKKLAENGLISIASFLSSALRLAIPIVAFASIIYLISHLSFLL